jgi:hypothetical protein
VAAEFQAALKLNPTNATALRNLQMIQTLQGPQP